MTETVNTPENEKEESTVDSQQITKLKGQLRAQAERIVVQRHQDEYHQEAERLFAEHGLEFTRRLSAKEKAEKELKELLQKHPELADKVTAVTGKGQTAPVAQDDTPAVLEAAPADDSSYQPF